MPRSRVAHVAAARACQLGRAIISPQPFAEHRFPTRLCAQFAEGSGDITCNAIAPAVVRTAMVAAMPDHQVKYMTDKIPMKRTGTLDEITSLILFVAGKSCSFTTGFCFDATGGRSTY